MRIKSGSLLPDLHEILIGKAKSIKYITSRDQDELERPFLRRFLQVSIDQIGDPPTLAGGWNLRVEEAKSKVYGKDLYLHGPFVGCTGGEGGVALGMFVKSKNSVMSG